MTKQELNAHLANKLEVLRPKYDGKKCLWRIEKWTHSGKWMSYGSGAHYLSQGEAQGAINRLCEAMPNNYKSLN